jgi:hypothetical protein
MIQSCFKSNMLAIAAISLIGMASVSSVATACTVSNWDQTAGGITDAANTGLPRFEGECGLHVTTVGQFVTDNTSADNVTQYVAAFYVKAGASDNAKVFRAVAGATEQFSVTVNGGNAQLAVVGGGTASAAISAGLWNHILVIWNPAAAAQLVVNGGAPTNTSAAPTGAQNITAANLGFISGTAAGQLAFDSFVSLRTNDPAITRPACPGDADGNRVYNFGDAIQIANDANLSIVGFPDTDKNGVINFGDAIAVASNPPACAP